jgi:hypothetical protein
MHERHCRDIRQGIFAIGLVSWRFFATGFGVLWN